MGSSHDHVFALVRLRETYRDLNRSIPQKRDITLNNARVTKFIELCPLSWGPDDYSGPGRRWPIRYRAMCMRMWNEVPAHIRPKKSARKRPETPKSSRNLQKQRAHLFLRRPRGHGSDRPCNQTASPARSAGPPASSRLNSVSPKIRPKQT